MLVCLAMIPMSAAQALGSDMSLPKRVAAGSAFSIPTTGAGKAVLYIVGPAQVLRSDVQLGEAISFPAGVLYNAGHYLVILTREGGTNETGSLDVVPASQPETLSFLAKPSRLSVGVHNGISGTVYVFDAYHNLITKSVPITFELSNPSSQVQTQTVATRNGVAWTKMNSAIKQGNAKFVAEIDSISNTRVIDEVPGDPCGLTITASPDGQKVAVQTAPLRDCTGNPVPDGTIVTFTESCNGTQSTVDAPLKQGFARVEMPACRGAKISAASGVVAGNEIRWEGGR